MDVVVLSPWQQHQLLMKSEEQMATIFWSRPCFQGADQRSWTLVRMCFCNSFIYLHVRYSYPSQFFSSILIQIFYCLNLLDLLTNYFIFFPSTFIYIVSSLFLGHISTCVQHIFSLYLQLYVFDMEIGIKAYLYISLEVPGAPTFVPLTVFFGNSKRKTLFIKQ